MPEDQAAAPAVRPPRPRRASLRPQTVILCLLAVGLVASLAANIRQEQRMQDLAEDLSALRLKSDRALGDLREAQSALLEQNVRRLDQMATQIRNATEEEQQKSALSASRMRSELKKAVEQKQQETMSALSDLKGDLRSETNARVSQVDQLEQADRDTQHAAALNVVNSAADHSSDANAAPAAETKPGNDPQASAPEKKKGFWSRMNPFSRTRKHETASDQ